jgi:starch synthase
VKPARKLAGKVLFVASECAPLVKTGGLADVVGALPLALKDWDVRVLLPGYPGLLAKIEGALAVAGFDSLFGGSARVVYGMVSGLQVLLLDAPHLFDRKGSIYSGSDGKDWPDNPQRFAALSAVAAAIAGGVIPDWTPDVLHLHDWQAGLAAAYLQGADHRPAIVTTVHNIAFQGLAPAYLLGELGLRGALFQAGGLEYYGQISALKAALVWSDAITTVSPTYAVELTTPEFGMGLEGVIRDRAAVLRGFLNGIDTVVWDPARDNALPANYSASEPGGKAACKSALEAEFGFAPDAERPLFAVVSRLTAQKGLDLLGAAFAAVQAGGARLVVLGSGEAELEKGLTAMANKHPDSVAVRIGYDEALSHRIFGGADAILIPSRFEPCGLTQLYGLRYGTIPVVTRTGGLADSVVDANPAALAVGVANGIQFQPATVPGLDSGLRRTVALFRDKVTWRKLMRNGMRQPVDWKASAASYGALYRELLRQGF